MLPPSLYNLLVPDAPPHRRTERDVPSSPEAGLRARAAGFLREAAVQPGLQTPSLVSSFQGAIRAILFAFPTGGVLDPVSVAAYRSVLAALRPGTRFAAVHNVRDRAAVEEWFAAAGHTAESVTYVPLPDYVTFTDWAEDGYVALHDLADGSAYLMEPWEFPRAGDALIAEAAQEYVGLRAAQAPLIFQGGNCLVGDDFWLLGRDYFADSVNLLARPRPPVTTPDGTTPEAFVRRLFADYVDAGRTLIDLGMTREIPLRGAYGTRERDAFFLDLPAEGVGTFQPIFHIDMFVTLIGRNGAGAFEVLVGSPRLADQLLGTRSPFGLDEVYDAIADDLGGAGFGVRRNPLVHRPTIGRGLALADIRRLATQPGNEALLGAVDELALAGAGEATAVRVRTWHHVTWNNCLVENSAAAGRHVYLPTYGHPPNADLRPLDEAMRSLWEDDLGFTAHLLGDFNAFARRQGVVHCIKKYLDRGE